MNNQNSSSCSLNNFLDAYNECWYEKDLEKLRNFYDCESDRLIYFDNHKGNDTHTVEDHLNLISDFFENGKETESGAVEPLIIENLNAFQTGNAACLCYIAQYESHPIPAMRCTLYLECKNSAWKIIHAHCSFEP